MMPLQCLAEPPVGSRLVETESGHEWRHYQRGWFCLCGGAPKADESPWMWREVVDDVGNSDYAVSQFEESS
jgi:hypothetical protein